MCPHRDSCCFDFVVCMCLYVCFAQFISLGLETFPFVFDSSHFGYIAAVMVDGLILLMRRVYLENLGKIRRHPYLLSSTLTLFLL